MINTSVYSYINVLDAAADATSIRNELIANNIANSDTPEYKRQDIDFPSVLTKAMGNAGEEATLGQQIREANKHDLTGEIYTDHKELSYRTDGNNVDIATENVELASNQIQYQYLLNCISKEFDNLKSVMK